MADNPPSPERVRQWIDAGVSVKGAPEHVFVKLYTHGTQEKVMKMLFDDGQMERMFIALQKSGVSISYVSAREMVSKIHDLCRA